MTIRDIDKFVEGLWDWGILKGCFGNTKIEPTDVDGLVERKDRFLLLEAKKLGQDATNGQMMTYKSLVKLRCFFVLIIYGAKNKPVLIQAITQYGNFRREVNLKHLREIVSRWYEYADGRYDITYDSVYKIIHG